MGEITAASQEQTSGIEQINQAITQMDQVTQQNAALVEEAAAAAGSLQEQAANLSQVVSVFKLNGSAQTAPAFARIASAAKPASKTRVKASTDPREKNAAPAPQLAVAGAGDWTEF
jgi:uncharacterized phage infection (PIP) family protein YhgE